MAGTRSPGAIARSLLHARSVDLWPDLLDPRSAWIGHLPFAFWLVEAQRPRLFVELGTHTGVSYCGFCQAIAHLALPCSAYAIDTWDGDAHTGPYPQRIHLELARYHDERFAAFSSLVKSTFDDAVAKFADGSIDLLHIDGLHTYEAVRHDFETWLPKLSDRAVVLLHDTNVFHEDFGVQTLWRELTDRYPSFTFHHEHGLGVLAVGARQAETIVELTGLDESARVALRNEFVRRATPLKAHTALVAQLEHSGETLDGAHAELERSASAAAAATSERDVLSEELRGLMLRHEQLGAARDTLAVRVAELQARADELRQRTLDLETVLARAHELRETDQRALAELREQRAGLDAELDRLHVRHEQAVRESAELEAARAAGDQARARQIAELENALRAETGRRRKLAADISEITSGMSWRWTAPLRWLAYGMLGNRLTRRASTRVRSLVRKDGRANGSALIPAIPNPGDARASEPRADPSAESPADDVRRQASDDPTYAEWIARYDALTAADARLILAHVERLRVRPTLSIVVPVYNTTLEFLERCVASVTRQLYPDWQLCLADDHSSDPRVTEALRRFAASDARIEVCERAARGGIAACCASALALARGDYVGLLDHDDELSRHALYLVAVELEAHPDADILFSDEDKIDEHGVRREPHFKPDFNHELLLGQNCISHFGIYRRSLLEEIGGFRPGFDGSQDYDLVLRAVAHTARERIRHIPFVLYHWRVFRESGSFSTDHLDVAVEAARRAIADHLRTLGESADVVAAPGGHFHRVRRTVPEPKPLVSVIVPTRDNAGLLERCVSGVLERTAYTNLELLVVDNDSVDERTLEYLSTLQSIPRVTVIRYPHAFNFSAINNHAAARARGELLCFLNDDVEIIGENWLDEMVALAGTREAGAVGAKLLYPDGTVQHGGVVLGIMSVANHLHKFLSGDAPGYFGRLQLSQELSAVTAACMVVRKRVFDEVGGFNAKDLAVAFNDVDLCLRIREAGYRNLWTPHATLYHRESASRGTDEEGASHARFVREVEYMKERWAELLLRDPAYNPNLSLEDVDMRPAFPPRVRRPWSADA